MRQQLSRLAGRLAARVIRATRTALRGRTCAALSALALLVVAAMAVAALAAAAARLRAPAAVSVAPPPFVAGSFLASLPPHNRSVCRFNYGLSANGATRLPPLPPPSPELGGAGPFRVLYNVLQSPAAAASADDPLAVTLCTHATADQVFALAEQAARWDAPLSVAVFAPRTDAALAVTLLRRLCACLPAMARVSAHLVFPARLPPDLSARALAAAEASVAAEDRMPCAPPRGLAERTFRRRALLPYPVNAARNTARAAARTHHVLVADVELLPSRGLATALRPLLAAANDAAPRVPASRYVPYGDVSVLDVSAASTFTLAASTPNTPRRPPREPSVYVLPVFEVEESEGVIPSTKAELLDLYVREAAFVFHRWLCPHCQRFPGLLRWLHPAPRRRSRPHSHPLSHSLSHPPPADTLASSAASSSSSTSPVTSSVSEEFDVIRPLAYARREPPFDRWEPIFVGTASDPLYSEVLTWEGRQDKMTQAMEMCLRGYRFVVLDGAFLVHVPGVKRQRREEPSEARVRAGHERANAEAYARIVQRLAQRYPQRADRCNV